MARVRSIPDGIGKIVPVGVALSGIGVVGVVVGTGEAQAAASAASRATLNLWGNLWFTLGIVGVSVGLLVIVVGVAMAILDWYYRQQPAMEIVFDPKDAICVLKGSDRSPPRDWLQLGIKVINVGKVGLEEVRVRMVDRDPPGDLHYMRKHHDNSPPYVESLRGVSCPADPEYGIYFDVALTTVNAGTLFFQLSRICKGRASWPVFLDCES